MGVSRALHRAEIARGQGVVAKWPFSAGKIGLGLMCLECVRANDLASKRDRPTTSAGADGAALM